MYGDTYVGMCKYIYFVYMPWAILRITEDNLIIRYERNDYRIRTVP